MDFNQQQPPLGFTSWISTTRGGGSRIMIAEPTTSNDNEDISPSISVTIAMMFR